MSLTGANCKITRRLSRFHDPFSAIFVPYNAALKDSPSGAQSDANNEGAPAKRNHQKRRPSFTGTGALLIVHEDSRVTHRVCMQVLNAERVHRRLLETTTDL